MNITSVRYSINRKLEYQIKTVFYEEKNVRYVSKEPYSKHAINHINNIYYNFALLKNSKFNIIHPKMNNNKIIFPFIEGENFANILIKEIKDNNLTQFKERLRWFYNLLMDEELVEFYETEKFKEIFGSAPFLLKKKSFKVSNIDLNFENLIIDSTNKVTVIDYEWVFNFPVPVEFVLYRVARLFMNRYYSYLNNNISIDEILTIFNIESSSIYIYEKMELSLMNYIGNNWLELREGYYKDKVDIEELIKNQESLLREQKDILQLFWSKDLVFNEDESISFNLIKNTKKRYKIELPTSRINSLRIDPCTLPGYVEISIKLITNNQSINLKNKITNTSGITIINNKNNILKLLCLTNDPQIIFENLTLEEGKKTIEIEMFNTINEKDIQNKFINEITSISTEYNNFIKITGELQTNLKEKDIELQKQNEKLMEVNKEIINLKEELKKQKDEFQKLSQDYKEIISTRAWKIVEFLRKFKFNFK